MANPETSATTPTVTNVLPSPILVELSGFTIEGEGFAPGLAVEIIDAHGKLIATVGGSAIDVMTASSIEVTYDFASTGTYSLNVVNPDIRRSEPFAVTVGSI